MRTKSRGNGFTLVEVITVMVIMGIIALFITARYMNTDSVNVNSEAEIVKSHVRYAQSRAMNTNTIWGINILTSSQYSLFQNGNTANVVSLPGQDSVTVTLPAGIAFSATGVISFDTWGKPHTDAAGTSSQAGSRVITLTKGSSTQNITITQNTGFIP